MLEKIWYHIQNFFPSFLLNLGEMLLKIIVIVSVILILLEVLKALKVLDWINKILFFFTKPLGISKNASMPLLIGITCGITYGAGAILASYANKDMNKKDVVLVCVFLCICHAVIEDTLLFSSIGANGLIVILVRFILAYVITMVVGFFIRKKEQLNNTSKCDIIEGEKNESA